MIFNFNIRSYIYVALFFMVSHLKVYGQSPTAWFNTEHKPWPSAMSGGFLAPQFSTFDLDNDGVVELITFDRFSGITQVWSPQGDQGSYEMNTDAQIEWPEVKSWMLVRDFNQDRIPDLFTQGLNGIAVYQGIKDGTGIRFVKMKGDFFIDDSLIFRNRSGGTTNIYHAPSDIPVIEDLDGDGDLDIMSFELSGSYLYYYENTWDKTGKELDYELKHNCWGYFAENQFSDEINLSNNQRACPPPFTVRHSGSTSCLIDVNLDSFPDLLLGDIGANSLKVLINKGAYDSGFIQQVNPVFADRDSSAILHYFPAAYKVDFNQDSINDVIVTVNDYPLTDDEGVWAFEGQEDSLRPFKLKTNQWLQNQYIDLGQYSTPYFMSVDGDDLQDLFVSYQITENPDKPENRIAFFKSISEREFQLIDLDFGFFSEELVNGYKPYLTSGDVDGDGDQDLLAGMSNGTNYLIRNGSGEVNAFEVEKVEVNWVGLKMLTGATPELYDIDGDGDLDVIAGADNGTFGLYINSGDRTQAAFDSDLDHFPNVKSFGQIQTVGENNLLGRSAPRIIRIGSDTLLVSGSYQGNLFTYRVNSKDFSSKFIAVEIENWPKRGGGNSRLAVEKNEKGLSRLLIGNIAGGLTENTFPLIPTNRNDEMKAEVSIFPNPLMPGEKLNLRFDAFYRGKKLNIYFTNGKLFRTIETEENHLQISTENWSPGLYFLQIIMNDGKSAIRKVIVQ